MIGTTQLQGLAYPLYGIYQPTNHKVASIKVEYHAKENPLNNSEKRVCIGQRLMYPIIKNNNTLPCQFVLNCHYVFRFLH